MRPGVYTEVYAFKEWIEQQINTIETVPPTQWTDETQPTLAATEPVFTVETVSLTQWTDETQPTFAATEPVFTVDADPLTLV